jgi:hypothetical protein
MTRMLVYGRKFRIHVFLKGIASLVGATIDKK